ncbi:hypothetical protein V7O61_01835 [Methanolobus sp. WCC1]|uniref:hypothetical protein n=1 Tax=unclassified Methanolobus TaxID=2629569 RepID=UPI0032542DEE
MLSKPSKTIIVLSILLLSLFTVLYFNFDKINNNIEDDSENDFIVGPTPPEVMLSWYMPSDLVNKAVNQSPYFPSISKYSGSVNYTRRTMMTVYYFDDYDDLEIGEQELYNYLEEHGNLQDGTVDITETLEEVGNDNTIYGPTELNVSLYESNETSGYFAVIIEPFMPNQSEYYVIYYGTNGKPIDEQNEKIKRLISREYSMINKNGYVRGLQSYR